MTNNDKQPDNVIRFPVEAVSRLGLKRADKLAPGKSGRMEDEGQMSLFNGSRSDKSLGQVVSFPVKMSLFEEALVLDENGDGRAEETYRRSIEEDDYPADAWCNLGVMKSVGGDIDAAFDCFAQSLTADPRHAESHYNIGNLYFEIGDLRLSRTHYERSTDISPDFASAFFNMGLVTALAEDYQAAHDALERYRELAPEGDVAIVIELLGYIRTAIRLS